MEKEILNSIARLRDELHKFRGQVNADSFQLFQRLHNLYAVLDVEGLKSLIEQAESKK